MSIRFVAIETSLVEALRSGRPDANGQMAERRIAPADGYPCRHCLKPIAKGEPFLVLAHRPFPSLQPYAEVGPIFLHADPCARGGESKAIPAALSSAQYIVRGYGADDRIVYGTGGVVDTTAIPERAAELLADPSIAYVHVRSAANNCYQCRVDRV
jgi:hypothetical protein